MADPITDNPFNPPTGGSESTHPQPPQMGNSDGPPPNPFDGGVDAQPQQAQPQQHQDSTPPNPFGGQDPIPSAPQAQDSPVVGPSEDGVPEQIQQPQTPSPETGGVTVQNQNAGFSDNPFNVQPAPQQPPMQQQAPQQQGPFGQQAPMQQQPPHQGSFGQQPPMQQQAPMQQGPFGQQPPMQQQAPMQQGPFGQQPPMQQQAPQQSPMQQQPPQQAPMQQQGPFGQQAPQQPPMQQQAPQQPPMQQQAPQHNKPKQNIVDLYWLLNLKGQYQMQFDQNEAALLIIGFNASYSNLRLGFYTMNQGAIDQSAIHLSNTQKVCALNMFPESAAEVLANKDSGNTVQIYERLISSQANWQPNTSHIVWTGDKCIIQSMDGRNNTTHSFTLLGWQMTIFENVLSWMIGGDAWTAALISRAD